MGKFSFEQKLYQKQCSDRILPGQDFPENVKDYKLIVQCGSCMLTRKMMLSRLKQTAYAGAPIVNYGMIISYLHGAIPRASEILPEAQA